MSLQHVLLMSCAVKFILMVLVEDFGVGPEHSHDPLCRSEPIWLEQYSPKHKAK